MYSFSYRQPRYYLLTLSLLQDGTTPRETKERSRVNFTKASCTLDASVKIYSYRVDDVHLSSYRVLANLNRTDKKDVVDEDEAGVMAEENSEGVKKRKERKCGVETIETNLGMLCFSIFTFEGACFAELTYLCIELSYKISQYQHVQIGFRLRYRPSLS